MDANNKRKTIKKKMKKEFGYTKNKYCYSHEKVKVRWGEQENDIRNNWPSRSHYIMTTFGLVIGTGNLAAFPRECLQYGGFVYIVMYMMALAVLGMPLTLLELAVGQYTSQVWYYLGNDKHTGVMYTLFD